MEYVKEFDPNENAKVTIGSNFMPWENAKKCVDTVKIAGYNYSEKYYEEHHENIMKNIKIGLFMEVKQLQ